MHLLVREKAKVPSRKEQWPQNWVELRPPSTFKTSREAYVSGKNLLEQSVGTTSKWPHKRLERVISGDQVWGDDQEQRGHLCAAVCSNVS